MASITDKLFELESQLEAMVIASGETLPDSGERSNIVQHLDYIIDLLGTMVNEETMAAAKEKMAAGFNGISDRTDIITWLLSSGEISGDIDLSPLTVTENGEYMPGAGNGYSRVVVDVSQGGGNVAPNDVNFYDYDGTIVNSYSAEDFATLEALPANPDRTSEGLTAQGWNWSISDAKTYVATYGKLDIGQMYITTDGKTHVNIHLEHGRTSPMLGVCPNGTVDVDWGDGSEHDTLTGTSTSTVQWTSNHNYAASGDYVIKLTVTGSMGFYGSSTSNEYSGLLRYASSTDSRNSVYQNAVQKVEVGSGVTSIGDYAFYYCYSLASVIIPDGVTSIGVNAFNGCYSLASVTIPDSVTSIGNDAFKACSSLASVIIPDSVTSIGSNAFSYCYSLTSVIIPDSVTSIDNDTFSTCYSLASVTIPDSITSIGIYAFNYCKSLASVTIPDGVTSIGNYTFGECASLASITIPDGVTSIGGNAFYGCYSLTSVTIPDSVTSIGSNAFYNCCSLTSVTIPEDVTSIGQYAFYFCCGLAELHFKPSSPPTISGSSAFNGLPADCIIYVPTGSLSAYTSESKYPSSSTYTYVEE